MNEPWTVPATITLVLLATLVMMTLQSLSARAITLEIPASAISVNEPRTRATLAHEDPTGGTPLAIPLSPFGGPFTAVGRWQLERCATISAGGSTNAESTEPDARDETPEGRRNAHALGIDGSGLKLDPRQARTDLSRGRGSALPRTQEQAT